MGGKCLDAGQTCIASDYLFCHEKVMNTIVHMQICMVVCMYVGMKMCMHMYTHRDCFLTPTYIQFGTAELCRVFGVCEGGLEHLLWRRSAEAPGSV